MKKIYLSTGSKNKVQEIKSILDPNIYQIIDKNEAGLSSIEVEENGTTLQENAILKAMAIWEKVKQTVIADDTGLFVEALNGEPGVYSARYSGENATDSENRKKLLKKLEKIKNRNAKFITCIALIDQDGHIKTVEGICEGKIALEEKGNNGFGYDSIFIPKGYNISFSEMSDEEKNRISHRAKAMNKLRTIENI